MNRDQEKAIAARAAVARVREGMSVGLGSGSTIGPDGALYVVTDAANGELWKIAPRS